MNKIQVLDQITIDKIAAGEVIERPASVVKELVENAIDANATSVTVEIKDGGTSLIRIADNGSGIQKEDVRNAFLRHSTSKIRSIDDLSSIHSLGFRGEALSSIASVAQVELLTKTKDELCGIRYQIEGGHEKNFEEAATPDGTVFLVNHLFYNIPARKKFLKTAMTEASHVGELMNHLALSHPDISFRFVNNGQTKLHTSGNGNLKDVIYHIYGRDIASNLLEIQYKDPYISISGFIGKPMISRGNRNFETYFINHRYIKSSLIYKAIEDAYKDYTMQHRFPFVVLQLEVNGEQVDVNVHPTKMDIRFFQQQEIYNSIYRAIEERLRNKELIPQVEAKESVRVPVMKPQAQPVVKPQTQPVIKPQQQQTGTPDKKSQEDEALDYFMKKMKERVYSYHAQNSSAEVKDKNKIFKPQRQADRIQEAVQNRVKYEQKEPQKEEQLTLFEPGFLNPESKKQHKIIGQVFQTYWLVEYDEQLYIIDQHAAHERVLYEKTLREMKNRSFNSQMISPPIVLNLTMQESDLLRNYMDHFIRIGFEIEEFGQDSYAIRAVPDNLFSIAKKELFLDMLDHLSDELKRNISNDLIDEKIASMSCKAAVKGNMELSVNEVNSLIEELLKLDNPYHCPHGRPTIISMSKRELEKKFKRII